MHIGLGLYRDLLTDENFRFAAQAGATHIVAHLTPYFSGSTPKYSRGGEKEGWGDASADRLWTYEEMALLIERIEGHGLKLAAIENFSPAFWSDILLDGPRRSEQMEGIEQLIRDAGRAGVPCIGYNFSIAGVWGWSRGPFARAGAISVSFDIDKIDPNSPIPDGVLWNMRYRPSNDGAGPLRVSDAQIWDRLQRFLREIVPVAEQAGVRLAAHPDDPPVDELRGAARLVNQPDKYDRLLDTIDSRFNATELCLGSLQEMRDGDIYETVRKIARRDRIGYVHFRNVRGKVPKYVETFIDEGDIDMVEIIRILRDENYQGVLIPDHTPELECGAPWHAGMAYALGYMRALVNTADLLGPARN